jgi:protein-S-isoprenylcysteine O-methyltransferase Ste14
MTPREKGDGAGTRLPDLGPRGEGWVIGQFVLIGLVVLLSLPYLAGIAPQSPMRWVAVATGIVELVIAGWAVASGFRALGPSLTPLPRPHDSAEMVEQGIYRRIRHPIYGGLILAAIGWSTLTGSPPAFVAAIALGLFMDAKARREEAWLSDRYPDYAAYRARTRRFLPGIY